MLRYPRPKLLATPPPDSEDVSRARELSLPADQWKRLFLAAVKRIEKADPAYAAALIDVANTLASTISGDPKRFTDETLGIVERWAPGNKYGINVLKAYTRFLYERDRNRETVPDALAIAAKAINTSPRSLRARLSEAGLDLHLPKGEMWKVPGPSHHTDWDVTT
jgi:hypothetical protein